MATAEEFVVVVIYLFLGFTLEKLTAEQTGMIQSRGWCCGRRMGKLRTEEHQLDSSKGPQQVVYNEVSPEYLGQAWAWAWMDRQGRRESEIPLDSSFFQRATHHEFHDFCQTLAGWLWFPYELRNV